MSKNLNVKILIICLCFIQSLLLAENEHDSSMSRPKIGRLEEDSSAQEPKCYVKPSSLVNFANGESYDFTSLVTFLTSSPCINSSTEIAKIAMSYDIRFSNKAPFRLDYWAKNYGSLSNESLKKRELQIQQNISSLYRLTNLTSSETFPLIGQLAILSPSAARFMLSKAIEKELFNASDVINSSNDRQSAAVNLSKTLLKLGATEAVLASEMARSVEEMALLCQADSLVRYFRALSAATGVEAHLIPTHNITSSAFYRGIKKKDLLSFSNTEREKMLNAVFEAIYSSVTSSSELESSIAELNESLGILIKDSPLTITSLKNLYKEAIHVLSLTDSQEFLSTAVAKSLTPESVFLLKEYRQDLVNAAKRYPEIAGAIQKTFLESWEKMWKDLSSNHISVAKFNRIKNKYFEPYVKLILEWPNDLIDYKWLSIVLANKLVEDEDIEMRFPKLVLSLLEKRDTINKEAANTNELSPLVSSLAENMAILWSLSRLHIPALQNWVKKYDN